MRLPSANRHQGLHFNITSLIDVVFLLIIFFLATSHFARSEYSEAIALPDASQFDEPDANEPSHRLVVTVTADGALHVAGRQVDRVGLHDMIQGGSTSHGAKFEVRLRADRGVPFREIEPILVDCARAGVIDVKFAVVPES